MAALHDIDEGYTNSYLIHGVFVIIAAGLAVLLHWSLTVVLVALAIALFRVRSGIEIDLAGRKARVYKAVGNWKFGSWVDARPFGHIDLRYTNEAQVMNSRISSTNVRVRTYDLVFVGQTAPERIFHDFTDYGKACKAVGIMSKGWGVTVKDEVQLRRQHAAAHAGTRRR